MLQWDPIGLPDDHDEYSNLLQAETFAKGRISTPPHAFYQHFESFHILQIPTYASKYPPGQALFLFLGIKLFGHPWYGVLLSCMIMASCLVWMIKGYFSTRWAFWAGIFIILRFALWNYWSSSYWGGAVAAIGGALIFGALPRFKSKKKTDVVFSSLCFGLGLAFLSQSRLFEGLLLSIIPGLYLLKLIYQNVSAKKWNKATALLLPAALVLIFNFSLSAFYNYKITGDPIKMPYSLHGEQYSVQPPFLFLDTREPPPSFNHDIFEKHYNGWEIIEINSIKDYLKIKKWHFEKFIRYFYYWPLLVVVCFFFIDKNGIEIPYWTFLLFCTHILFTSWFHPHYFAPALAIYYLLLIQSIRHLITHRRGTVRMIARIGIPFFMVITIADSRFFATRHSGYINGSEEYMKKKQRIVDELNQTRFKIHVIEKPGKLFYVW